MKFFGNGIVWDKERSKKLCRFKDGVFETKEDRVKDILLDLGYDHDGEIIEEVEYEVTETIEEIEDKVDLSEKTVAELREMAKLAGFTGIYSKTKDELINMIEGD